MRALLLFLILVNCSYAQGEAPKKILRVAALQIVGTHHTLWLRAGAGQDAIEVPLNTRSFSLPIIYKGPTRAAFYETAEAASAEEPPAPICVATLNTSSTLLVFSPKKETYQSFAIAEKEFPFGSFRFFNSSKALVRAELDRKTITLAPGKSESIAYSKAQEAITVRILAVAPDKKPRVIRQSSWSIGPNQRELILFFPNPHNGLVLSRHFVDSKSPES